MTNATEDYNTFVRANLPSGMTYSNFRYWVYGKPFVSYKQAKWYLDYTTKMIYLNPPLNLDFTTGTLPDGVSFTRAGTATYFDAAGVLKTAAANQPRFDYDPVTKAPKGLLIEGSRTNLLTYSSEFGNASWGKTNCSVTENASASSSGLLDADLIVADGSVGTTRDIRRNIVLPPNQSLSFSCELSSADAPYVLLSFRNRTSSGNSINAEFDLVNGVISIPAYSSGTGAGATAKMESLGGGRFRCSVSGTADTAGTETTVLFIFRTSSGNNSVPAGVNLAYIAAAQLEAGAFPSSYIPTTSAAATRAADSCLMSGANFSRWFNPTEGTLVFEAQVLGYRASTNDTIVGLFGANGATDKIQTFLAAAGPNYRTDITSGGVNSFLQNAVFAADIFKTVRCGMAWSADSAYSCSNFYTGNPTDTSVVIPSVNRLVVETLNNALYIRRIRYWPRRLSNARLQELTA